MRSDDVNQAIEWAKALPVLGDSPKAKLLAEEVERLQMEIYEMRQGAIKAQSIINSEVLYRD